MQIFLIKNHYILRKSHKNVNICYKKSQHSVKKITKLYSFVIKSHKSMVLITRQKNSELEQSN